MIVGSVVVAVVETVSAGVVAEVVAEVFVAEVVEVVAEADAGVVVVVVVADAEVDFEGAGRWENGAPYRCRSPCWNTPEQQSWVGQVSP